MMRRAIGILAVASVLPACGDLASAVVGVSNARYTTSGDVVAFLPRDLVTLDGQLAVETGTIPLGLPAGAEDFSQSLSADGQIVAITWIRRADGMGGESATDVIRVADQSHLLRVPGTSNGPWLSASGELLGVWEPVQEAAGIYVTSVYDVASGKRLWWSTDLDYGFAFSPDGTRVYGVGGLGETIAAWDSRTGERLLEKTTPMVAGADASAFPYHAHGLAISSDGQRLLVLLARQGSDEPLVDDYGWFRTSDLEVEQIIPQAEGYNQSTGAVISPDGQRFASVAQHRAPDGWNRRHIQMWTSSGTMVYAIGTAEASTPSFSPDGSAMVAATAQSRMGSRLLSLFRVSDGQLLTTRAFTADPL